MKESGVSRRDFLKNTVRFLGGIAVLGAIRPGVHPGASPLDEVAAPPPRTQRPRPDVALVRTESREDGVMRVMQLLGPHAFSGKRVMIKPNFNTADPVPGSTHNDTLEAIIRRLQAEGASSIVIGERAGPPDTHQVMTRKGIYELAERYGVEVVNFDRLPREDWIKTDAPGSHWRDGFLVPKPLLDADAVVSTACLKTHQYGGHFTLSLKNSVGIVPRVGYGYMTELHRSRHMRAMIAEINYAYHPDLVIMDGIVGFTDGGPSTGVRKIANLFWGGPDRVAIDAVGVAILKMLGSNRTIMDTPVFRHEQIARAVELGLGTGDPGSIAFKTDDAASADVAATLRKILAA